MLNMCLAPCFADPLCPQGACCPLDGSRCVDRLPSECLPGVGLFDPRKDCSVAKCDSLADQPGACCMLQAGTATCRDNIGQDECNGTWTAGRRCASVQCLSPLGACCDAPSGRCRSNITLADCQNPAAWQEGSICGHDSFCVGGCCDSSTGACSNVQRAECTNAASWSLYDMCNSTSCRAVRLSCIGGVTFAAFNILPACSCMLAEMDGSSHPPFIQCLTRLLPPHRLRYCLVAACTRVYISLGRLHPWRK